MSAILEGLEVGSYSAGVVDEDFGAEVTIEWRGPDSWGVYFLGKCASRSGELDMEPSKSNRNENYLKSHRFPLEKAAEIARQVREEQARVCDAWKYRGKNGHPKLVPHPAAGQS